MVDFFRGRYSWRKLANLVARLPDASQYAEAQKNDPDYARQAVEALEANAQADAPRKWSPRPAEWTTQHELMAAFFDRLGDWLVQHANANRPKGSPRIKPLTRFPRPVTAVDRERAAIESRVEAELDDLIDRAHAMHAQENPEGEVSGATEK